MMPGTVAIFGGSFNPPHVGHVLACAYLLSTQPVDEVLVVPVFHHVFGKELATFDDRLAMCRLAMEWIPGVRVSDIERELGGESRTLYTIEALRAREPDRSYRLVIGADVLADLSKWHRFDRIAELAPPLVLGRAGHPAPGAPPAVLPEVSSTVIRALAAAGRLGEAAALVPRAVARHIAERRLYQEAS
jgi:nicotinate-nucleotide adenylyltransferase